MAEHTATNERIVREGVTAPGWPEAHLERRTERSASAARRLAIRGTTVSALLLLSLACDSPGRMPVDPAPAPPDTSAWNGDVPPRDESPVQTDSLEYTLRKDSYLYDAHAIARYVNRTGKPVYFARCLLTSEDEPLYLLRREPPDTGRTFVGSLWMCVGGVPSGVIAPGDSIRVRVWLGSTESPMAQPPITMAQRTGLFRVYLQLFSEYTPDSDLGELLPEEQRRSNAFAIRGPS